MTKQPDVLQKNTSPHELTVELRIPDDLVYTEGHFEHTPVVPGVVLFDWAMDLAGKCFSDLPPVEEIRQLKFRKPLQPGDTCTLDVHLEPDSQKLSFKFSGSDSIFAEGWCTIKNNTSSDQ